MTPLTSVLIVDDEPAVRDILARWATSLGLSATTAASTDEALAMLETQHCDLAVIDIMMPGRDGLWLADALHRDHPGTALVIATAYTSLLDGNIGALPMADLLVKPFARERFAMAMERGRQWREVALEEIGSQARLTSELRDRTKKICAEVGRQSDADQEANVLLAMAEERNPGTMAHAERVARYALGVARELGLSRVAVDQLEWAARFHDIGKLTIPECLLNKPCPLTPLEQTIVRCHVNAGAEILSACRSMHEIAAVVLATHEWFGGGGYPLQLAGADIPLGSRIIAVVDAYDAMTQDRQYRGRIDSAEAVSELVRGSGTQFDPGVVSAFLAVLGRH